MYDTVRYVLLGLIFAGLLGLWLWSRRQAALRAPQGPTLASPFRIVQKRWLDQRTGICLVEAEDQTFLLAYTAGSVSWQTVPKTPPASEPTSMRLGTRNALAEASHQ